MQLFFFFNDTATTEIYTLSLHDALPICKCPGEDRRESGRETVQPVREVHRIRAAGDDHGDEQHVQRRRQHHERSEEHTSELQSRPHLVCRLLLEKKKQKETPVSGGKTPE